jgi:hypothetical protein
MGHDGISKCSQRWPFSPTEKIFIILRRKKKKDKEGRES